MKIIKKERGSVYCNDALWKVLNTQLTELQPSSIFILTDENTRKYCLPYFLEHLNTDERLDILEIPNGEAYKNIASCTQLWDELSTKGADRKSILINLGGGVVTDLGGFVACTFKRGIEFINIPTSLLAMVDASVGGKNGVDLGSLKNQIGVIKNPYAVFIDTHFLQTLPETEITSGLAEMLKHGLISSEAYWEKVKTFDSSELERMTALIWESVEIKNQVVTNDPNEQGLRKTLNYGHTLGHAIESYFMDLPHRKPLLHGEAIAIGLILATYISSEMLGFPKQKLNDATQTILHHFPKVTFDEKDIDSILTLLKFDKKNSHGKVYFILLSDIGIHKINCEVPNGLIYKAFDFYKNY
ncbi:3-dehydroquinate synthase [Ulvibacter sp. MAR_2010_11]|uniref:3-dehydroquinate synthase n=1 Tax=Ulvibacter sp. MAR_2010_11 TaxID=1250229 RepID=UPI000C2C129B|nr:3-dehydroquinate synthase [Ulvibacter sp. MAR_2010_11]PKA84090.1 3-dehydroquinate synthase [Ulvibacter sp. MAR_2010_11]